MNIAKELAAMEGMTTGELQDRYEAVCGERPRSRHRTYLVRRIAWRLQARAEGGLTQRALRRAEELADDADVRVTPPRAKPAATGPTVRVAVRGDTRLPPTGSAITRQYRGRRIEVRVRADGFEYLGDRYKSLTAVAKAVTGSHVNGFRFFGLETTT